MEGQKTDRFWKEYYIQITVELYKGQRRTMEQRCKGAPYLLPMWCTLRKSRASLRGMHCNSKIFAALFYQSYRGRVSKSYNNYFQNDCNNCCCRLGRRCRKLLVETRNTSHYVICDWMCLYFLLIVWFEIM